MLSDDEIFKIIQLRAKDAGALGYGINKDGSEDFLFFNTEEDITEFLLRFAA